MQIKEAQSKWATGEKLLVAEYRGGKIESLKLRDKDSGTVTERVIVRHQIEFGSDAVSITEWQPAGTLPTAIAMPFKKGDRVIFHLYSLSNVKGVLSAQGTLELLTP